MRLSNRVWRARPVLFRHNRGASQRHRCLVLVDHLHEWKKTATGKQPSAIALADRGLMALRGLWANWRSPAGEWIRSFAIVTCPPNELCAELHNRMPVVLGRDTWPAWLGEPADPHQLKALLAPYPSDEMTCWPVSTRVGKLTNNDPSLIEPERTVRSYHHIERNAVQRSIALQPKYGIPPPLGSEC